MGAIRGTGGTSCGSNGKAGEVRAGWGLCLSLLLLPQGLADGISDDGVKLLRHEEADELGYRLYQRGGNQAFFLPSFRGSDAASQELRLNWFGTLKIFDELVGAIYHRILRYCHRFHHLGGVQSYPHLSHYWIDVISGSGSI